MTGIDLPLIHSYRPRTFGERGLVGPFTTPTLAGARLRRIPGMVARASERTVLSAGPTPGSVGDPSVGTAFTERRRAATLEVIVPNPSGGRGVYILPWGDIGGLCRPTMHDVVLGHTLCTMLEAADGLLTPLMVSMAARQTASQGPAGRAAAKAAAAALARRDEGLVATRFTLLMDITEQIESRGAPGSPLVQAAPDEIQARGRSALRRLAAELNQPQQAIADALDLLAACFVDIGIGLGMANAHHSRVVAGLASLQRDLVGWAQTEIGERDGPSNGADTDARDAVAVAGAAELAARMARLLLDGMRALAGNMPGLIADCLADPRGVSERCEQVGWLLDGWEPVTLLWQAAPGLMPRHVALQEMVRQVPALPDQADSWLGLPAGTAERMFVRPSLSHATARDDTSSVDRIARNERLRAMAG